MDQPDLFDPRDLGHAKAEQAADRAGDDWKALAYAAFVAHAEHHSILTTEDVRVAAVNVPAPPDGRAWGAITRIALNNGIIELHGHARAKQRHVHGMRVTQWRSKIARQ